MRLLDRAGRIAGGRVMFDGRDITRAGQGDLRRLRGSAMSMIFQNPRAALNPIRTVEGQIADVLRAHRRIGAAAARAARWTCCARCGSATRSAGCTPTRPSCRAACASA